MTCTDQQRPATLELTRALRPGIQHQRCATDPAEVHFQALTLVQQWAATGASAHADLPRSGSDETSRADTFCGLSLHAIFSKSLMHL